MLMAPKATTMLVLVGLALSACASREEIAARKAETERLAASQRDARCASFGHKRGSPDFSRCLESMYVQDQQMAAAKEAEDAARVQRVGDALQQAGDSLSAISPPPPPVQPMREPVRCNRIGNTATCY